MGLDALWAVALGATVDIFGVPATVTLPDAAAISTSVIWLSPTVDDTPVSGDFQRRSVRRLLAVSRSDVPTLPRGTIIAAAETDNGTVKAWEVDEIVLVEVDLIRAVVIGV